MAKKHVAKKAAKRASKAKETPVAAPEVPMKQYAEPAPQPAAPTYPAPAPTPGYGYPPAQTQQPYQPQSQYPTQGQRPPYNGGGNVQGQGEFTRITGLFASKTKMGSSSAVLKENELGLLRQIAATATPGDKLGVSLDRNGRPFLWFMKVR